MFCLCPTKQVWRSTLPLRKQGQGCSTCCGTGFLWLTLILEVKGPLGLKISFSLETPAFTVSLTQSVPLRSLLLSMHNLESVHASNKYFMRTYCVPANIPGSGVIKMNRLVLCPSTRMQLSFGPGGHVSLYEARHESVWPSAWCFSRDLRASEASWSGPGAGANLSIERF